MGSWRFAEDVDVARSGPNWPDAEGARNILGSSLGPDIVALPSLSGAIRELLIIGADSVIMELLLTFPIIGSSHNSELEAVNPFHSHESLP